MLVIIYHHYLSLCVLLLIRLVAGLPHVVRYPPQPKSVVSPRTLVPNSGIRIENDWLLLRASATTAVITPNSIVAQALQQLYLTVSAKAIHEWHLQNPELEHIFYTFGPFTLIFVPDAWGKTVPWDFIAGFCQEMVGWTDRGFLGTYDRRYWNLAGTLGIYAALRVNVPIPTV